jgi:hypothetical protein
VPSRDIQGQRLEQGLRDADFERGAIYDSNSFVRLFSMSRRGPVQQTRENTPKTIASFGNRARWARIITVYSARSVEIRIARRPAARVCRSESKTELAAPYGRSAPLTHSVMAYSEVVAQM